jgi:hypothetical protein
MLDSGFGRSARKRTPIQQPNRPSKPRSGSTRMAMVQPLWDEYAQAQRAGGSPDAARSRYRLGGGGKGRAFGTRDFAPFPLDFDDLLDRGDNGVADRKPKRGLCGIRSHGFVGGIYSARLKQRFARLEQPRVLGIPRGGKTRAGPVAPIYTGTPDRPSPGRGRQSPREATVWLAPKEDR